MVNRQVNRRDKGGKGSFDYRPSDPKKLRERAERSGGQFDSYFKQGVDLFKPKVGENAIRIMPPTWKGHDHFGLEVWVHGYVGTDRSSYLCPKKMLGKKCPICEAAKAAIDAGEKDEGDDIKAKQRVVYYILDRDGDSGEPEVWSVSWTMDKDISGRCEKRSGKILELDNPWEGHDVTFRRTGQGLKTRYINVDVDSDKTALADRDKEVTRLLDHIKEHPLDSILKYYSYDHLAGVMDGTSKEKDEDLDEDEDDKPRKKRRGRDDDEDDDKGGRVKSKKKSRDEDEDEDEDDRRNRSDDRHRRDLDDDEDEKKSKRRGRDRDEDEDEDEPKSKSKRGRDRDEDEDEDDKPRKRRSRDDDEDEDEKPRKRRGRDEDEDDPADEDDDSGDDDDAPKKKRKSRDDYEDEDDKPKSKSKRRGRDEDEDDEIPSKRRGRAKDEDDDADEDEDRPRKRRR